MAVPEKRDRGGSMLPCGARLGCQPAQALPAHAGTLRGARKLQEPGCKAAVKAQAGAPRSLVSIALIN